MMHNVCYDLSKFPLICFIKLVSNIFGINIRSRALVTFKIRVFPTRVYPNPENPGSGKFSGTRKPGFFTPKTQLVRKPSKANIVCFTGTKCLILPVLG